MPARIGPLSTTLTESTWWIKVGGWSRVPGSMFQASYSFGVSLNACNSLPQELGARVSKLAFLLKREVMHPVDGSTVTRRLAFSMVVPLTLRSVVKVLLPGTTWTSL